MPEKLQILLDPQYTEDILNGKVDLEFGTQQQEGGFLPLFSILKHAISGIVRAVTPHAGKIASSIATGAAGAAGDAVVKKIAGTDKKGSGLTVPGKSGKGLTMPGKGLKPPGDKYPMSHGFKLSDNQKVNMRRALGKREVTFRISKENMNGPDVLFLTKTQHKHVQKALNKGTGTQITLSQTQLEHQGQEGGALFSLGIPLLTGLISAIAGAASGAAGSGLVVPGKKN